MTPLQQAAQAVIARWESPLWKYQLHTGVYIAELRKALEAEQAQAAKMIETGELCGTVQDIHKIGALPISIAKCIRSLK
jgi:signal transduction histidine kinase